MTDAYELGFAPGIRADYTYQCDDVPNVEIPVVILDNDFRNPDLDYYLDKFELSDPSVAILGDAYDTAQAQALNDIAQVLRQEYPYKEYVIVPKYPDAFSHIDEEMVLGYAMGYSDTQAQDVADLREWRDRKVHLLGASPHAQYEVIEALTQPTLTGDPPADIIGLDWNGVQKVAYHGEYWTPDGWQAADHLSIRETVRTSLQEIKQFWQNRGVWPNTEPIDLYGPAVRSPDEPVYAVTGADIQTREQLEASVVIEYSDGIRAYRTETEQAFLEWQEDLETV